jgi:predicted NUDIX family NTP pyrophosphohydrolase
MGCRGIAGRHYTGRLEEGRVAGRSRTSAGILLFRSSPAGVEVLLAHPGGPWFSRKDAGHWTIPKGEVGTGEELVDVARREFAEETGTALPDGALDDLGSVQLKSGKQVLAFAAEGDLDPAAVRSNTFSMEWPPRSGRRQEFPEIDRAEWFPLARAREKLVEAQAAFVDRLEERL